MKLPPSLVGGFHDIVTLSSRTLSTARNLGGSGTSFNNKKFLLKFKFVFSLFQYYLPAIWMLISQLSEPSELDNTNL